jgi:hypothetical protein
MIQESEISYKQSSYFLSAKIGTDFKISLNVSDAVVLRQTGLLFWTLSIVLSFFKHGISKSGSVSVIGWKVGKAPNVLLVSNTY